MKDGAGLYIHIPFCDTKCGYCDFASFAGRDALIEPYIDALLREIERSPEIAVKTVYIGGGTPSLLSADRIETILAAVGRKFRLADNAEVTMEMNPSAGNSAYLKDIHSAGVNRLSIGVQSFNKKHLKTLGRRGDPDVSTMAINNSRKAGFDNLSLDLMYGVPEQTTGDVEDDIRSLLGFSPEHVSAYQLTVATGTPFHEWSEKGAVVLPDDDVLVEMYDVIREKLGAAGYRHYEISNFAIEGRECRHNLGYWLGDDFLGLGSASHSFMRGKRFCNPETPAEYISAVIAGNPARIIEENHHQKLADYLLMRFRLINMDLEFNEINQEFNIDFLKEYGSVLGKLQSLGLLWFTLDRAGLSDKGVLLLNNVILEFIEV
jgi:oxygen-independent coproporphyrinogen-3 oxidase